MRGTDKSFLGTGWSFPPTFSREAGGIELVSQEEDIRQSLWILLSTSLGERIMVPTYGCQIRDLLFDGVTTTWITHLRSLVSDAVLNWEPRIDLDEVSAVVDDRQAGLVHLSLHYTVRQTNSRSNLVYPFYVNEATLPLPPA
jgi:phage baseplate assembly protein W